jgi:hypothetical protein
VVNAMTAALTFARMEGSLLRSVTEAMAEAADNVPYLPSNQALALLQSAIEEHTETPTPGTEAAFDTSDAGWIKSAFEKLKATFCGKHKFTAHTSLTSIQGPMWADAVVTLYSDWGTGEDTAQRVMAPIKAARPTHAIHLGDVYYSGTEKKSANGFSKSLTKSEHRLRIASASR